MRYLFVLLMIPLLSGCWFIYIPGSVTSSITDSITGAEGSHCVSERTRVGDKFRIAGPTGHATWVVKSLSGTSVRCTDPLRPVRALIVEEAQLRVVE